MVRNPLGQVRSRVMLPQAERKTWLMWGGGVALVVALVVGGWFWWRTTHYVTTDNALISGSLIQVSSLSSGRITHLDVDVGDVVRRNQVIAGVSVPVTGGSTSPISNLSPLQAAQIVNDVVVPVTAVVVAKPVDPGDVVQAGQPIITVVDLGRLWVTANVDETDVSKVVVGQPVEIYIDTLHRKFRGKVEAITPASAATFSLLPQNNASGNFTKVVQRVPVRVAVDYAGAVLFPGTSVEVSIRVK